MFALFDKWAKAAALEAQEYVRLTFAAFRGMVTPPLYRHDIVEQFDALGIGSLLLGYVERQIRVVVEGNPP